MDCPIDRTKKYTIRNSYLLSNEELERWQVHTIFWSQYDNIKNRYIEESLLDIIELEESAVSMAINTYGVQRNTTNRYPQGMAQAYINNELHFYDQQAVNAALILRGLGLPPTQAPDETSDSNIE